MADSTVTDIADLLAVYQEKDQSNRDRMTRAWKFYSGVNYGQWTESAVQTHKQEKRPLHTINWLQNKIDTINGAFLQNPFDTAFESSGGKNNDSFLLETMWLHDKELGGWEYEKAEFLRAGLIHTGILEIFIDYSRSPFGDIGLRYKNPFFVWFDPMWASAKINDNKRIIEAPWMDAEQIKYTFHKRIPNIDEAIVRLRQARSLGDAEVDKIADRSPELYDQHNNRYKVIQVRELRREKRREVYDAEGDEFLGPQSSLNMEILKMLKGGRGEMFKEVVRDATTCHITTAIPGLANDMIVEEGSDPTSPMGRYPYFVWSAKNLHGERQGYAEVLMDPQEIYNKRQTTYTHAQTTASNGAKFIEENFFSSTEEKKRYIEGRNMPGQVFTVRDGTISSGRPGLMNDPREPMPTDMLQMMQEMISISDRLAPATPATQGIEGKSGESAKLHEAKKETALAALEPTNVALRRVDHEIGEAYYHMVKLVYGDGIPREFQNPKTKRTLQINIPGIEGATRNDVAKLSRQNIVVTQNKAGVSMKRERLQHYTDIIPNIKNPLLASYLELEMIECLPGLTDQNVQDMKDASYKNVELQHLRIEAEKAQIEQALQAAAQPPQPAPGAPGQAPMLPATGPSEPGKTPREGGGFTVDGKAIPPQGGVPVDMRHQNQLR